MELQWKNNRDTEEGIPPLRLILNHQCNGNCEFCHHEGYTSDETMSPSMINECANIAEKLNIPHLSLTGGEPTLRIDLAGIIRDIQDRYHGKIALTTNGYNLARMSQESFSPLYVLNLSISSFDKNLYTRYQNVDPVLAIKSLRDFPALNKNLNLVITKENYKEINDIFLYCINHSLSLDIMFELRRYTKSDIDIQQYVLKEFYKLGHAVIKAGVTPSLVIDVNTNCKISIKHPELSLLIKRRVCHECTQSSACYERICSVRVYPDGIVSPCISQTIKLSDGSLSERIKEVYALIEPLKLSEMQFINPLA